MMPRRWNRCLALTFCSMLLTQPLQKKLLQRELLSYIGAPAARSCQLFARLSTLATFVLGPSSHLNSFASMYRRQFQ